MDHKSKCRIKPPQVTLHYLCRVIPDKGSALQLKSQNISPSLLGGLNNLQYFYKRYKDE